MKEKKYNVNLDIIRNLSCIAVFLYHLNILKGGYLAVCTFFVLSGFLSSLSSLKKDKFSILGYYKKRILNIYLPLLIVTLITIFAVSLIPEINWISLKPETTSVLLGYNNFWQINANMDYFARHINSPFMHFWYIAILLQFDLIFPFIFIMLKKLGDKVHKSIPCIALIIISIESIILFYVMSLNGSVMTIYYNTLARMFSIFLGITLGFIQGYYGNKVINKNPWKYILFILYISILVILNIFIAADSKYFILAMILTSLITCRLLDYATKITKDKLNVLERINKWFATITYEIYLIQYPVIFIFQYINMNEILKIILIIIITIILSYILHISLEFKKYKDKEDKIKVLRYLYIIPIIGLTIYGGYLFYKEEDHTQEMKDLEDLLNKNESVMLEKQEEYKKKLQAQEQGWQEIFNNLENDENQIKDIVRNLPVVGVGDSVMLGAVGTLYETFPNGYFDAKVSRTDYEANDILVNLKYSGMLGEPVIFNLGTNGQCGESCRQVILNTLEGRKIFWVTVTNNWEVNVNDDLKAFAERNENVRIIDWESISAGHYDYFVADGIHLTPSGRQAYANAIYDGIYQMYLDEYNAKKEKIMSQYNAEQNKKITFYGNDLLLNSFEGIQANFENANFEIDEYDFDKLLNKIKEEIENKTINHRIVFMFDNSMKITNEQYKELVNLLPDNEIYIVDLNGNIKIENVTTIEFTDKKYIMVDRIHLNDAGNKELSKIINERINKQEEAQ